MSAPESLWTLRRKKRGPIKWNIDAWREPDGSWTAEVFANGHGFGRSENRGSWRKAIDKAMSDANAVAEAK